MTEPNTPAGRALWRAFNDPDPSWIDDGEEILRAILAIEAEARTLIPSTEPAQGGTE